MPVPKDLLELLKERDLVVKAKKNNIVATHTELPVSLVYRFSRKNVVIEIESSDDLVDYLVDLAESGENIEEVVDDILSELRDIAIETSKLLGDKGYKVELKLREGENDVRDRVEEVLEEYLEFEEEEEF